MANPTRPAPKDDIDPLARLKRSFALSIVVVIPIVALAYWFVFVDAPGDTPAARSVAAPQVQATAPDLSEVSVSELDAMLNAAREAEARFDVVAPSDSNAVQIYLRILRSFPEETRARLALDDLLPIALDLAQVELREGDLDEAQRVITLLELAYENSRSLVTLRGRLDELVQQQEQELLATEESARRLEQARIEAAAASEADAAAEADTIAAQEPVDVREDLTEPEGSSPAEFAVDAAGSDTLAGDVAGAAVESAGAAEAPFPVASRIDAAPVASAVSQTPEVAGPEALRIVEEFPPSYPPMAMRRGIEGWVEVEFLVRPDGSVDEINVLNAEPARVFDREAVRAVSRWRFEPFSGSSDGIRARKTLQFSLGAGNN